MLTSTWFVGVVVAAAAWKVAPRAPGTGLDESWILGLYMATHQGLHFGTQAIWTYGPLGFTIAPVVAYRALGVVTLLYASALFLAACLSLVWALRRRFNLAIAAAISYLTVVASLTVARVPGDVALALPAFWCLAALSRDPPPYARSVVAFGGGVLGATQCLVKLSVGPTVLLACGVALAAQPTRWRDLARFSATALATFAALWFATGQGIGNLPDYVSSGREVIAGYSQAMGVVGEPDRYLIAAVAAVVVLVGASVLSAGRGLRRAAAGVAMALLAFLAFKEGVVRFDAHIDGFFATATLLTLAVPWRRELAPLALPIFVFIAGLAVYLNSVSIQDLVNPVPQANKLSSETRYLFDSGRWNRATAAARSEMRAAYGLDPATLRLLRGHTVDVRLSEAGIVWAYGLDWRPEPVFQAYGAYTSALDRDNADTLASSNGPDRILRDVTSASGTIDQRNPKWEPPLATVAMLCHYAPLHTTPHYQVLGRASDRCGQPHLIRSVNTSYGRTVTVPRAPHAAVVAKVHGAGVSGLESLRTFFLRAKSRFAIVNGIGVYRLVPGTAADGLLMSVPKQADFPGHAFHLSQGTTRLSLSGLEGSLRIDFYAVPIRSWRSGS